MKYRWNRLDECMINWWAGLSKYQASVREKTLPLTTGLPYQNIVYQLNDCSCPVYNVHRNDAEHNFKIVCVYYTKICNLCVVAEAARMEWWCWQDWLGLTASLALHRCNKNSALICFWLTLRCSQIKRRLQQNVISLCSISRTLDNNN